MADQEPLLLTNSMGRRLEEFHPIESNLVRMYTCGPTVYSYAHIGNFRSFLFADVLRRVLKYNGYNVRQVRNITDVGHLTNDDLDTGDDKIEREARRVGKDPYEIARLYTDVFWRDAQRLNILQPEEEPLATTYVDCVRELIGRLIERGHAYPAETGVYYDVSSFPAYGRLSGNSVDELIAGKRVEVEVGKRCPADFALWKLASEDKLMRWPSPWGTGVPGWHLECSAMAIDLLGERIDIHTGGVDHLFPHHEDEIAQSEGATGQRFANYWLHGEFLQLTDEKMSKSKGTIYTVSDLIDRGIHPLSFRYFSYQAHYRTKLVFSWDALNAAQTALFKLWEAGTELVQACEPEDLGTAAHVFRGRFHKAINRDLDMPQVVAIVHELLGTGKLSAGQKLTLLLDFDAVLGLDFASQGKRLAEVTPQQQALVTSRAAARTARDWVTSDELRDHLSGLGLEVKDTAGGQRWIRRDLLAPGGRDRSQDSSGDESAEQTR